VRISFVLLVSVANELVYSSI